MIEKHYQLATPTGIEGSFSNRQEAVRYWSNTYPDQAWDEKNLIEVAVFWELNEWSKSVPKN
jgi:hypothetical protein